MFKLSDNFVNFYRLQKPDWGFASGPNSVGELTYARTYSRIKEDGTNETWAETVRRVVEGTYEIQRRHAEANERPWDEDKAARSAQEMYDRIFNFKFTPSGRGLWMMGTDYVMERKNGAPLQNCAFISTEELQEGSSYPFTFLMDMLMLGVGVGFDTDGAGAKVFRPESTKETFVVPDSREGWVEATGRLTDSYLVQGSNTVEFDYSVVRKQGEPIKGFGGTASGPSPLIKLHERIRVAMEDALNSGGELRSRHIVDIQNMIGACVVAGNIRRCLPAGTHVNTTRGIVPIEDIVVGDGIVTPAGKSVVSNVFDQGEQETVIIKHQFGDFECTPNHRVAVFSSLGEWTFKRADELQPGDRMVWDSAGTDGEFTSLPAHNHQKSPRDTRSLDMQIPELDSEVAWLIGLIHGDGYVFTPNGKTPNGHVSIACHADQQEIVTRATSVLRRFGLEPLVREGEGNYVKIFVFSTQFAQYMSQFKKSHGNINIPDAIKRGTRSVRSGYLMGLFDADGSSRTRPINAVMGVYIDFLRDVQSVYTSLGVATKLRLRRPAHSSETTVNDWMPLYAVDVVGQENVESFIEMARFSSKFKHEAKTLRSANGFSYSEDMVRKSLKGEWITPGTVTSSRVERFTHEVQSAKPVEVFDVIPGRTVQTYDIEVDEIHQFTAEGFVVHNSAELSLGNLDDDEFLNLKNYERNPERAEWGWASNNTLTVRDGDEPDYQAIAERISDNGEPGLFYLDVARKFGRMGEEPDFKDMRVKGTNPCQIGSVRMLTKEFGLEKIENLSDKTFTVWNGEEWSKSKAWHSGVKPVYRVSLTNGQEIELTADHRLAVLTPGDERSRGRQEVEMRVEDIRPGQPIKPLLGDGTHEGVEVEQDFATLAGLVLGDGWARGPSVYMRNREEEVLKFLNDFAYSRGLDWNVTDYEHTLNGLNTTLLEHSIDISNRLPERSIPEVVFGWSADSQRAFLRGLFTANGGAMHKHNRIDLKTTCKELASGVQMILLALGYNAYITTNGEMDVEWDNGTYTSKESYDVNIAGAQSYARFQSEIGFLHKHKSIANSKPEYSERVRATTVKSVEYIGEFDVYDFTEPKIHWGWANGFKSHNCAEQMLESGELCNLVEVFPTRTTDIVDFLRTLKFAYLYAKTVTLIDTHDERTNEIMRRNRRIGTSISGIVQFVNRNNLDVLEQYLRAGYGYINNLDRKYSDWLDVPESIRKTTVKPSGSVSLLAGATPGVHYPTADYYIRRIRLQDGHPLVEKLVNAGYKVEPDQYSDNTSVVEMPVEGEGLPTEMDVSVFDKADMATFMAKHWSDNAVSCTITFQPHEAQCIETVLRNNEGKWKTVSFLPISKETFPQMPYEQITKEQYEDMVRDLKPVDLTGATDGEMELYCETDVCEIRYIGAEMEVITEEDSV